MSRPITPASGMMSSTAAANGPASGLSGSRPASYIGPDAAGIQHHQGAPQDTSFLGTEDVVGHDGASGINRSNSQMSQSATYIPSRGGTLKKKTSLHKMGSLKRSGSRKSSYAGSVRSLKVGDKDRYEPDEYNSAFYCPIPTATSPTEILANRFQGKHGRSAIISRV